MVRKLLEPEDFVWLSSWRFYSDEILKLVIEVIDEKGKTMQNKLKVVFRGKSNTRYEFKVFPLETIFEDGGAGVFFVTKYVEKKDKHTRVFVGETKDFGRYFNTLCKFTFSELYGANSICCHFEEDSAVRGIKLRDLRDANLTEYKNYPEANDVKKELIMETDIVWEIAETADAA